MIVEFEFTENAIRKIKEPKMAKTKSKLPKIIGLKESLEDAINNQDEQEKKEEVKCT